MQTFTYPTIWAANIQIHVVFFTWCASNMQHWPLGFYFYFCIKCSCNLVNYLCWLRRNIISNSLTASQMIHYNESLDISTKINVLFSNCKSRNKAFEQTGLRLRNYIIVLISLLFRCLKIFICSLILYWCILDCKVIWVRIIFVFSIDIVLLFKCWHTYGSLRWLNGIIIFQIIIFLVLCGSRLCVWGYFKYNL